MIIRTNLLPGIVEQVVAGNKVRSGSNGERVRIGIKRSGVEVIQLDIDSILYSCEPGLNTMTTSGGEKGNVVPVCFSYLDIANLFNLLSQ